MNLEQVTALLSAVPSQTTVAERLGLYSLTADEYGGHGYIYDIGTAAGGSTYCLALGLDQNERIDVTDKRKKILGFDLFEGYSLLTFKKSPSFLSLQERVGPFKNDLELFAAVTEGCEDYISPIKLDIRRDFHKYKKPGLIEIAHIDAAKSIALWRSICPVICEGAIPGVTTFVFQDFMRCRLPWQWLFIAEVIEKDIASWKAGFDAGTVHLKIDASVPDEILDVSIKFSYSESRAVALWEFLYNFIKNDDLRVGIFRDKFDNIALGTLAYIYKQLGRADLMKETISQIDESFLKKHPIYAKELGSI